MKNIHIKALNIESYRGLKQLKLENFTGVNIFTGENNCGKTSVLELLYTAFAPTCLDMWLENTRVPYDETGANFYVCEEGKMSFYTGFASLFDSENAEKPNLKFSLTDAKDKEHIVEATCKIELEKVPKRHMKNLTFQRIKGDSIVSNCLNLTFCYEKEKKSYKIYECQDALDLWKVVQNDKNHAVICKPVFFLSSTGHTKNFDFLTNIITDSEFFPELLEILKEFDKDVLNIVKTEEGFMILTKKFKKAVPLNIYGDGMKKTIMLIAAVVFAKGGILLVDEFETAIHTSVMTKIYAWILKSCKKLGVQLFLTTHSKEALEKLLELDADPKLAGEITVYTIQKKNDKQIARRLNAAKALEVCENFGLELR